MKKAFLVYIVAAVAAVAQSLSYSPIRVSISAEGKVESTNSSDRAIRAFVVFVDSVDGNGKSISTQAFSRVWGDLLVNGKVVLFEPGKTERTPGGGTQEGGRAAENRRVGVDLVVFGDGTVWGPQQLKQSSRVLGWIEGMHMQRQSLKRVLDTQGPVEVANQITQLEQQTQRPR